MGNCNDPLRKILESFYYFRGFILFIVNTIYSNRCLPFSYGIHIRYKLILPLAKNRVNPIDKAHKHSMGIRINCLA